MTEENSKKFEVKIYASHFLEPIPEFLVAVENNENELNFNLPKEGSFFGGFNKGIKLNNGKVINAQLMRGGVPITPKHPLSISIETMNDKKLQLIGVMHKTEEDKYEFIPRRN